MNGIKTDLDGNDIGSMPFTTSTATIAELLDLLPPTSHCDELKRTYFDVFSPVSFPPFWHATADSVAISHIA